MDAATTQPPRQRFNWWKFARTLIGLVLAPTLGAALGVALITIPMIGLDSASPAEFFSAMIETVPALVLMTAMFGAILGLGPALLIGWPVHLLLLSRGWTSIWVYIVLGAILGTAGMALSAMTFEALDP